MSSRSQDKPDSFVLKALALVLVLFSFSAAHAQSIGGVNSTGNEGYEEIHGRIHFPAGHQPGFQPVVKLESNSSMELTALANLDGNFSFTRLRPESYTIIVNGGDEFEDARETVAIGNSGPVPAQGNPFDYARPLIYQVQIYLQPKRVDARAAARSAALARVPASARDLFNKATALALVGQSEKAIEQLKAAIAQAPNFALAYTEMGAQYLKLGQAGKASEALAQAVKLNPGDFDARLNYGIALVNLKKSSEAEQQLRQALQTNAGSSSGHYYLGVALMSEHQLDAAESEFKTSIMNSNDGIAAAHKYLGGIYWHHQQYTRAADELEKYLKLDPKAADAVKIRGTIEELRSRK